MSQPETPFLQEFEEVIRDVDRLDGSLKRIRLELEARKVMEERKQDNESRLLKRGPLEIRTFGGHFIAAWSPDPKELQINGGEVTCHRSPQEKIVDVDPYLAATKLIERLREKKAWDLV